MWFYFLFEQRANVYEKEQYYYFRPESKGTQPFYTIIMSHWSALQLTFFS